MNEQPCSLQPTGQGGLLPRQTTPSMGLGRVCWCVALRACVCARAYAWMDPAGTLLHSEEQNAITPKLRQMPHLDKAPNAPTSICVRACARAYAWMDAIYTIYYILYTLYAWMDGARAAPALPAAGGPTMRCTHGRVCVRVCACKFVCVHV